MAPVEDDVKGAGRRRYTSAVRTEQATATRRAVLRAARELFAERGYAGTSIAAVAAHAGVAVDTVYAAAGRKPARGALDVLPHQGHATRIRPKVVRTD